ncbi:hypothetical protein IQ255_19865 [Pleurocapsales cyanobacterium LEGE 10410]|nr:hypothetical protein [Pleurocapsales cyanobacterium LEGE 10410]
MSKLVVKRSEPKIWQKHDPKGNIYWLVFDPFTSSYSYFSSEQEVRIWIEKRYHRCP